MVKKRKIDILREKTMEKTRKIGLKLYSTNIANYLPCALALARHGVMDYLELYLVPGSLETLDAWRAVPLPVVIHAPHLHHGVNFADASRREVNRRIFGEVRQFADALHADCIICHGGTGGTPEETVSQIAALRDERIVLENKPHLQHPEVIPDHPEWRCRGASFEEFSAMVRAIGCGVCHDLTHTICSSASLGRDWKRELVRFESLGPRVHHLSDMVSLRDELDTHEALGQGVLELDKVLAVVPDGARITLETPKHYPDSLADFEEEVRLCRAAGGLTAD